MISIITSSRKEDLSNALKKNILETIGVPHEYIPVSNPNGEKSIFQAYNEGAEKSKYEFLCFVHEDVNFITNDWGAILLKIMENPEVGLIGLAGSRYKGKNPNYSWSTNKIFNLKVSNIIQTDLISGEKSHTINNPDNSDLTEVAVLDGVFLVTRRQLWNKYKFDESSYKGFHLYDLDFSMSVLQTHRIFVTFDILLEHYSLGSFNRDYIRNALIFHKKWKRKLPVSTLNLERKTIANIEYNSCFNFSSLLTKNNYSFLLFLKYLLFTISYKPFSKKNLNLIYDYLNSLVKSKN